MTVKALNDLVRLDRQSGTHINLRGAASLILSSKADIPHEQWTLPVLVVQPGADRMTPAKYIKKTFKRLGSIQKHYIELDGAGHFPVQNDFYQRWAIEFNDFIKRYVAG